MFEFCKPLKILLTKSSGKVVKINSIHKPWHSHIQKKKREACTQPQQHRIHKSLPRGHSQKCSGHQCVPKFLAALARTGFVQARAALPVCIPIPSLCPSWRQAELAQLQCRMPYLLPHFIHGPPEVVVVQNGQGIPHRREWAFKGVRFTLQDEKQTKTALKTPKDNHNHGFHVWEEAPKA